MKTFGSLVKRNSKLFFKDKGLFFVSLITPLILLVLYITFLGNLYRTSFEAGLPIDLIDIPDDVIDGLVGGQLFSSLLSVCCITIAFCSNMLMVQDKITGAKNDFLITPVKRSTLALSYYISTFISTFAICIFAFVCCMIYVVFVGWFLSVGDVFLILLDIFLLVMFGTALSSIINHFLSSQGQISAVGSIVSSCYGFICGAYMPISNFSEGLRNIVSFLPGTYGTSLLRNHTMAGSINELESLGVPESAIKSLKDAVDCNIYCFENNVSIGAMYGILIGSIIFLIGVYVLINILTAKKKMRKREYEK